MEMLDFKGLSCPQPVIGSKKYLDENPDTDAILIVVDNRPAVENIKRFLSGKGFDVAVEEGDGEYRLTGRRDAGCEACSPEAVEAAVRSTLVMVSRHTIGTAEGELGGKLMVNFIKTLKELGALWRLVFVNEGVKLTVKGAETLEALKELEESGVSILVCGTCLDYYGLLDDKQVGETTNMLDIVTSLQVSEKVINI